jgi:hypothetical protein
MGLVVYSYRKLKVNDDLLVTEGVDVCDPVTGDLVSDATALYINRDFPGREEGIVGGVAYTYDQRTRCFNSTCGYYCYWRSQLADLIGYCRDNLKGGDAGPFVELIEFSDCEGTIGPVVSAKLAKDFIDYDVLASAQSEVFYSTYVMFKAAFEMAADDGAVEFC